MKERMGQEGVILLFLPFLILLGIIFFAGAVIAAGESNPHGKLKKKEHSLKHKEEKLKKLEEKLKHH